MATEQDRNAWNNRIGNPFEPLNITQPNATAEARAAYAAEFTAHYMREINEKLTTIERLMKEKAGES